MRNKIVWGDEYRGIHFQIENFSFSENEPKDKWAFYLFIKLDQMPGDVAKRFWLEPTKQLIGNRKTYAYYEEALINGIDFHCGCTWYSKESGFDDDPRIVKIGCDYQHLYDEDQSYSAESIAFDAKQAIDSLIKMVPNIKVRCGWTGKYVEETEIIKVKGYHGVISKEGAKRREEYLETNKGGGK